MISSIRGNLIDRDRGSLVLETDDGVGYAVTVSTRDAVRIDDYSRESIGASCVVLVRSVTRETGTVLYGFCDREDRTVFDRICAVSGCGPGVAMKVLGAMPGQEFVEALYRKDVQVLAGVKGLGAKMIAKLMDECEAKL